MARKKKENKWVGGTIGTVNSTNLTSGSIFVPYSGTSITSSGITGSLSGTTITTSTGIGSSNLAIGIGSTGYYQNITVGSSGAIYSTFNSELNDMGDMMDAFFNITGIDMSFDRWREMSKSDRKAWIREQKINLLDK